MCTLCMFIVLRLLTPAAIPHGQTLSTVFVFRTRWKVCQEHGGGSTSTYWCGVNMCALRHYTNRNSYFGRKFADWSEFCIRMHEWRWDTYWEIRETIVRSLLRNTCIYSLFSYSFYMMTGWLVLYNEFLIHNSNSAIPIPNNNRYYYFMFQHAWSG